MKVFIVILLGLAAAQVNKIFGSTAAGGAIPYQVRIEYATKSIRCGASLIASNWVVSAAHCKGTRLQWNTWKVILGYYDGVGDNSQTTTISNQIVHENYNLTTRENDIMVLQLSDHLTFNSYVGLISLPAQGSENLNSGVPCVVSGWGTQYRRNTSDTLLAVTVNYVTNPDCNAKRSYKGKITGNMLCLASASQGDSGGPAVCDNILEGIVSWSIGPTNPGVYTRVSQYRDWITDHTDV